MEAFFFGTFIGWPAVVAGFVLGFLLHLIRRRRFRFWAYGVAAPAPIAIYAVGSALEGCLSERECMAGFGLVLLIAMWPVWLLLLGAGYAVSRRYNGPRAI